MLQERFNPVPETENSHEAELLLSEVPEISLFAKVKQRFGQLLDWARDKRLEIVLGVILVPAAAACGGGSDDNAEVVPTNIATEIPPTATRISEPSPTRTPVAPTSVPTEAPKVIKTILDQPVVPVTIQALTTMVNDFYGAHPEAFVDADKKIYPKQYLDNELRFCEIGDPQDAGVPKLIAVDRLGSCAGITRIMHQFYKLHGNEELWKIAVSARNYFVTQYPSMKDDIDSFLRKAGIN